MHLGIFHGFACLILTSSFFQKKKNLKKTTQDSKANKNKQKGRVIKQWTIKNFF